MLKLFFRSEKHNSVPARLLATPIHQEWEEGAGIFGRIQFILWLEMNKIINTLR